MLGKRAIGIVGNAGQGFVCSLEGVVLIIEHLVGAIAALGSKLKQVVASVKKVSKGLIRTPAEVVERLAEDRAAADQVEDVLVHTGIRIRLVCGPGRCVGVTVNCGPEDTVLGCQTVGDDVGNGAAEAVTGHEETVRRVIQCKTVVGEEAFEVRQDHVSVLGERTRGDVGHDVGQGHGAASDDRDQVVVIAVYRDRLQGERVSDAGRVRAVAVMGNGPGKAEVTEGILCDSGAGLDSSAQCTGADGQVQVIRVGVAFDERFRVPGELDVDRFADRDAGVLIGNS